ncbi:hypothetical protein BS78_05G051500 [Paspalum vaginatum]|nr:hypothetical protein BS78_05G051500 [Paspalum vaginatum]
MSHAFNSYVEAKLHHHIHIWQCLLAMSPPPPPAASAVAKATTRAAGTMALGATAYLATATEDGGKAAAAPGISHGSDAAQLTMTTTTSAGFPDEGEEEDEDDELFELDIARLDGRGDEGRRHGCSAAEDDDGADHGGHALLANCLLPLRSVSKAVPVDAFSSALSSYPYFGYHSARRLVCTGASSRRFLFLGGRPVTGSSARFCFSSRGFETIGNYYFQRY